MFKSAPVLDQDEIDAIVAETRKKHPKIPEPKQVVVVERIDHTGEPALEMIIVFPDRLGDNDLRYRRTGPLVENLRELVLRADNRERWVYPRVRRRRDANLLGAA